MTPGTLEWVAKAEGDFRTASRERAATIAPNHDAVCFHAQQCVEKYLNARLIEAGLAFQKTHDLVALLGQPLQAVRSIKESARRTRRFLVDSRKMMCQNQPETAPVVMTYRPPSADHTCSSSSA